MNFLEAQKFIKQKEYGKALDIFLKLQKNGIKNNTVYFYLGLIYSELNDFNKSILNYTEYLKFDPDQKVLYLILLLQNKVLIRLG